MKVNCKTGKRKQTKPLNIISIVYFLQTRLLTEKLSRTTTTIRPGIFLGRALWADSREFKHNVYGRRQTAKMTSEFVFFSSNP